MLPFRLLYLLSDGFYILTYYIIGYRKKIVRENLALTLPHLSDKERLIIEKKSYQNMCDVFLEMIKTLTISKSEMEKRYKFKNIEVYDYLEKKGKRREFSDHSSHPPFSKIYCIILFDFRLTSKINDPFSRAFLLLF